MARTTFAASTLIKSAEVNDNFDGAYSGDYWESDVRGGWLAIPLACVYSSADSPTFVFTLAGDVSAELGKGMRIRLVQSGTTKYFIVTNVSYSLGTTTVTVYGGTDYTLANAAISAAYFSPWKAPVGFPLDPAKWTQSLDSTTNRTPTPATDWTSVTDSLAVPIGLWILQLRALMWFGTSTTASRNMNITLSADATTETHPATTATIRQANEAAAASHHSQFATTDTVVDLTSATTFTIMVQVNATASVANMALVPSIGGHTRIIAICAYL